MAEPSDRALRGVLEATRRITATLSVDEALAHCANSARSLLGAEVTIASVDGGESATSTSESAATAPPSAPTAPANAPTAPANAPTAPANAPTAPANAPTAPPNASAEDPLRDATVQKSLSWLEKNLTGDGGDRIGNLRIGAPQGTAFSEAEHLVAADLAEAASIAIRNAARLHASGDTLRRREDILSIVAHDLRNPLNTISMSLALMRQDATPRETPQLDRIGRAMHRMNRLIGDLLDASALDQGRLRVVLRPELAAPIAQEAADNVALAAKALASRIEHDSPGADIRVSADRDRLIQVLSALLANALKFSPEKSTVRLGVSRQGASAVFTVSDQGPGIDPAHVKRIFERHYKVNPASRDGTGLGLFIARGVVEAHRGTIRIDGAPGRGTIVSVAIPLAP